MARTQHTHTHTHHTTHTHTHTHARISIRIHQRTQMLVFLSLARSPSSCQTLSYIHPSASSNTHTRAYTHIHTSHFLSHTPSFSTYLLHDPYRLLCLVLLALTDPPPQPPILSPGKTKKEKTDKGPKSAKKAKKEKVKVRALASLLITFSGRFARTTECAPFATRRLRPFVAPSSRRGRVWRKPPARGALEPEPRRCAAPHPQPALLLRLCPLTPPSPRPPAPDRAPPAAMPATSAPTRCWPSASRSLPSPWPTRS